MSAQEILAKHLERIAAEQKELADLIAARQEDRKGRLQGFFARNSGAKAWADEMKATFGDGVRMKWFRDGSDDSRE